MNRWWSGCGVVAWVALAWLVTAAPAHAAGERTMSPGKTWLFSFAADTLGRPPAATREGGGRWEVQEDSAGSSRLLSQLEGDDGIASHSIQFLKPLVGDQEISVRFRIRSGGMDPSVGLGFQLDPKGKSGYLVRVSGRSRELIAHYFLNGKRRDLRYIRQEAPRAGEWHTLAVRRAGEVIEIRYDGTLAMKLRDERFHRGNVGLWTEDDTVADFAELTVRAL